MINFGKVKDVLSPLNKAKVAASIIVGSGVGLISSLVVNSSMLEVSINGFFTFYFCIILIVVGSLMYYRSKQREAQFSNQPQDNDQTFMKDEKQKFFTYSSWVVLAAGVLCLLLEKDWNRDFPYILKVPIYILLGMSLTYLVSFAILDFMNFASSYLQHSSSPHAVESTDQIVALLANCFVCGLIYGLVFSVMDIEDSTYGQLKNRFFYEIGFCMPIGIIGGALGGLGNEILRQNVSKAQSGGPNILDNWRQSGPLRRTNLNAL